MNENDHPILINAKYDGKWRYSVTIPGETFREFGAWLSPALYMLKVMSKETSISVIHHEREMSTEGWTEAYVAIDGIYDREVIQVLTCNWTISNKSNYSEDTEHQLDDLSTTEVVPDDDEIYVKE